MKIIAIGKMCTRLCVCTTTMSILLLPVQAAETVPVPFVKPVFIDGSTVPVPSTKPALSETKVEKEPASEEYTSGFKAMTLNLASLFSTQKVVEQYPHGYVPISGSQSEIYARIFETQSLGSMDEANALVAKITDDRLMGHVLYQRYMHPSYKSSYQELQGWMAHYADHPSSSDVYKLAISRQGENKGTVAKSEGGHVLSQVNEPMIYYPKRYVSGLARSKSEIKSVKSLSRKVHKLIRKGQTLEALKTFRESPLRDVMDAVEHDTLQSVVAQGFLYQGKLDSALKLAAQSSDRSGKYVPLSSWVSGLALWQQGDYARAATYFDKVGNSAYASGWLAAGGSFWAARSYREAGAKVQATKALKQAAKHSRTFYGLMAAQSLGQKFDFNWTIPKFTKTHEATILEHKAGHRAMSLVAAQQYDLAERELMRLDYSRNKALRPAVLAYASHVGLPGIALRLGNMLKSDSGRYYDSALYPVSPWKPTGGYKIDPALVHAVIRQESRFNLNAKSYSGAQGLMQVMPKTAQYVADTMNYATKVNSVTLHDPETNMMVGQDYIDYLLEGRIVKGDVVSLLIAYNAGPGNLQKWRKRVQGSNDPLLFIEMLPVKETRDYVERVLSNYWIYRNRAGLSLPSLAALSKGKYPRYAHVMQDNYPYQLAANQ